MHNNNKMTVLGCEKIDDKQENNKDTTLALFTTALVFANY